MKETESKSANPKAHENEETARAPEGSLKKLSKAVTALTVAAPLLLAPPAAASAETLNQLLFLREAAASSVSVEHPILKEAILLAQQAPDGSDELAQQYGQNYGQTYNQTYTESYTQVHGPGQNQDT